MRLADKIAIVTGAASGIGLATARLFCAEGAKVALADLQDTREEAATLQRRGWPTFAIECDVSSEEAVRGLFSQVLETFSRVDVLVNAAGIGLAKTVADTSLADWQRLVGVNLTGVFLCCREAVRQMRRQGNGVIVNVASELALVGGGEIAAYAATKGGVLQLTRAMAVDHSAEGIRINAICPGPVETPLLAGLIAAAPNPEAEREDEIQDTLLRRFGQPDEIARAILFLASDDSSYVVGSALIADGGLTAH
jgi:meso-butanediol dehydrogenase/(S,S)-butanediol dehydrogenase/diacetyl reductase